MNAHRMREIPAISDVIEEARRSGSRMTDESLRRAVRAEVEGARESLRAGGEIRRDEIIARVVAAILEFEQPRITPILNATGVVIHTNLGRAPVSAVTADAMREAAAHAVAVEIDPKSNARGGRMREVRRLLHALTGAESALVVNNCAAAVLLALSALTAGREVVVSRGEAVEIGGGFRVPDVLRQSGATLVEVGTTNRTYARDYAAATNGQTAAYLKVHASNFRVLGFVHAVSTAELVELGRERDVPILEDLGSGALLDTSRFGLAPEPTIQGAVEAGAALVMASGDKLIGGPQAGIIAGGASFIAQVERHPLARAVRADKTTLAGLAATLRHYLRGEAETQIPIWRMIGAPEIAIRKRAERIVGELRQVGIAAELKAVQATIGGGSLPGETLPSWAIALAPAGGGEIDEMARRLRLGQPGVFGRVDDDRVILDLRTVLPEDDEALVRSVRNAAEF